ncbi:hypothetical protein [Frigoribacterium sp. CG_9.8]|uniref:hypothetical protein n=1 Tax=Frigoribacterium sp. CG_9.8 TaxID=2787733 RepID=UPI0018CB4FA3|nr:hypothetical protein [Frigoribacterium sp. CG_9.8]MBG6106626.1 hypothetical protein [Frigoribacterium sp. CG_9.8]
MSFWLDRLRVDGFDPEAFGYSIGNSVWTQHTKDQVTKTLYSNRFSATLKPSTKEADERLVSHESVIEAIRSFTYVPQPVAFQHESFVLVPTDFQFGKVDWNGGSKETMEQVMESFSKAAAFVKEFRPREVAILDAGDIIENIYSTSAQLGTNDLDLPHQVVEAAFAMQKGLQMLAPLAPSIRYAAVSSNHGAHRIGPKSPAGDAHSDYGLAVAKILGNALTLNPAAFGHVTVQTPEPYMESLYFQTSGSDIGLVHSHQASGADKIGEWWKGQSHGNMPVSQARILVCGHWHSLRVQQSGDSRWIMVGPASDRGSSWYTNLKGEQSESGMLSFTTANNVWNNLRVL